MAAIIHLTIINILTLNIVLCAPVIFTSPDQNRVIILALPTSTNNYVLPSFNSLEQFKDAREGVQEILWMQLQLATTTEQSTKVLPEELALKQIQAAKVRELPKGITKNSAQSENIMLGQFEDISLAQLQHAKYGVHFDKHLSEEITPGQFETAKSKGKVDDQLQGAKLTQKRAGEDVKEITLDQLQTAKSRDKFVKEVVQEITMEQLQTAKSRDKFVKEVVQEITMEQLHTAKSREMFAEKVAAELTQEPLQIVKSKEQFVKEVVAEITMEQLQIAKSRNKFAEKVALELINEELQNDKSDQAVEEVKDVTLEHILAAKSRKQSDNIITIPIPSSNRNKNATKRD